MIYEMVAGCPPWEYKIDSFGSLEKYFEHIQRFATEESVKKDKLSGFSEDLQALLR